MLKPSFVFAVLIFLMILLFFTNLPDLKTCRLPHRKPAGFRAEWGLLAVTLVYSVTAFWHLGNTRSPQTFVPMTGQSAIFSFPEPSKPATVVVFHGVGEGSYSIEVSDDTEGWYPVKTFTQDHGSVFKWELITLGLTDSRSFMRIHCTSGTPWLGEVLLLDIYNEALPGICNFPALTDEADTVPPFMDSMNSSIFDEVYHVRTAWEHLNGIWPYEVSHPPLGKLLISLGTLIFGMTPFGWRFCGTVTGILMLPAMYAFLRRLFGGSRIPLLGTILLAAGFMHYTQTRIATLDSFAVLFILLMYYFMLGWRQTGRKLDLLLCGICFGLGAATKWICIYAVMGLLFLWFGHWIGVFRDPEARSRTAVRAFLGHCCFCVLCFIIVPGLIYYLAYIPYGLAQGKPPFSAGYTKLVLDNQSFMLSYHANVRASHPYASRWWTWILDVRPILYFNQHYTDGGRETIACFVNPVIAWAGLVSLLVLLYCALWRHDGKAAFLLVCWAAGLVPWFFIVRPTFIYHYFASALFLIPAICYVFALMEDGTQYGRFFTGCFTVLAVVLFLWFFPVLSGLRINHVIGTKLHGWLPSWPI